MVPSKQWVTVDLVLPLCNSASAASLHWNALDNVASESSVTTLDSPTTAHGMTLQLQVYKARVLWRGLRPLFFESPLFDTRRALRCLLEPNCMTLLLERSHATRRSEFTTAEIAKGRNRFLHRRVKLRLSHHKECTIPRMIRLVLWPPLETQPSVRYRVVFDDYVWTGLLLRWEHQHIQATSLSGYIATLGGGFFLCHHFTTAIYLARLQQQLALFLHDEAMYYTCAIHQAYSHVYAGHFSTAWSMLQQILDILQAAPTSPSRETPPASPRPGVAAAQYHPVLIQMCYSARLFCKRMRKTARRHQTRIVGQLSTATPSQPLATVIRTEASTIARIRLDDYQRIRVVHDKSKVNDLVIPFSRASVTC